MIKSLFPRYWPRYVDGRYGGIVCSFANWIIERRYTRQCAKGHVRRFLTALNQSGASIEPGRPIPVATLARYFAPWADDPWYRGTHKAAERFLVDKGLLISREASGPFDSIVAEYRCFLIEQRGFAMPTVSQHLHTVGRLLKTLWVRSRNLSQLSREDVERFVDRAGRRLSRHSVQHHVAHLRAFLGFCSDRGLIKNRIEAIDAPRAYRGELPPRALPWNVVRKLLASIDRSDIDGCRDHAILYLMAHYGLRPSEVAALTIDSVNWDERSLRVEQRKTHSVVVMPVDERALRALKGYLRRRPRGPWRELFLRVRCPAGPIKAATISDIFENRARRSGLPVGGSSAYCLRHSFAMRLLERGVGVKMIGDLLGHHSLESTCVYLRLHTAALREAALPLPLPRSSCSREAAR